MMLSGLVLVILFVYWSIFSIGFLSDDYDLLLVSMQEGSVLRFFGTNLLGEIGGHSYGPIYNIVFATIFRMVGLAPAGFHVITILLHIANSMLVYLICKRLTQVQVVAIASAFLFAVFHTHTSSIAWISVLPHLLATAGYLLGIYFYLKFLEKKRWWQYVGAIAAITCAIFAKEIAITAIAALLLLDMIISPKESFGKIVCRLVKRLSLPTLITGVFLFFRNNITGSGAGYYGREGLLIDLGQLWKMFVDISTNMFFSYPYRVHAATRMLTHPIVTIALLTIVAGALLYMAKGRVWRRRWLVLVGLYVIFSLPILQVALHPASNEGERYTYLLSSIFVMLLSYSIYLVWRRISFGKYIFTGLMSLIIASSAFVAMNKMEKWVNGSRVVDQILATYTPAFLAEDEVALFVGMPDNYDGVQLLRNGLFESITLLEKGRIFDVEKASARVILDKRSLHEPTFVLEKIDPGYRLRTNKNDESRVFKGAMQGHYRFASVALEHFRNSDHTGTTIRIKLDEEAIATLVEEGKQPVIVYFDNGTLHKHPVALEE